jgi:hypothetical protein
VRNGRGQRVVSARVEKTRPRPRNSARRRCVSSAQWNADGKRREHYVPRWTKAVLGWVGPGRESRQQVERGFTSLPSAAGVAITLRPVLDVPSDYAVGILDELHNRAFHAEAIFRLRDEWNLSGSARIEHQMVGLP